MRIRSIFSSVSCPQRTGRPFRGDWKSSRENRDEAGPFARHPREFLTPGRAVNILGVIKEGPTHGRTGSAVRKEFHDYFGGLRVQLGAQERHLAPDVWAGVLRHRNDRLDDLAVRHGEVWRRGVPAVTAPGRPDDRGGDGDAKDGARAKARVGTDAGPQVVH